MAAEDVMVDSMMRIFEKSSQFDFQGSFEGWSKRLVVNQALGYLRSKKNAGSGCGRGSGSRRYHGNFPGSGRPASTDPGITCGLPRGV
ncbi:MAG: hypothetical protein LRY55_15555 [Leadbetterella sp.]|nr:hypothetical protein [Leadbetterella sp.]